MISQLKARLAAGEKILIDGATGTELEKRGVPMVKDGWNAAAALTHPEILQQIHEDYIKLGAEIIITNTFSTARRSLMACGLADDFAKLNTLAVELAIKARKAQNAPKVLIAGGIAGGPSARQAVTKETMRQDYMEQAKLMADAGADLIISEMMYDAEMTTIIIEAAEAVGLPIWLGFSCRIIDDGQVVMYNRSRDFPLEEFLGSVPLEKVEAAIVMHTLTEDVDAALAILKQHWSGPTGVYAHSGKFISPNWQFVDMISPEDYATEARRWLDSGVQIIGGCCGIGTEHIARLSQEL